MSALKSTAIGWLIVSLGHTISAKDWQSTPKFTTLPTLASTCAKAGWYQGSGFFIMNALLNYAWSQDPSLLQQPVHKAIAAVMVAIVWVSAGWYAKRGVGSNAAATALIGAVQGYAAFC
ncbi:hypothetical protein BDW42DRAFT_181518 [Aspergillus taichungensis]|uniref:Integral membrane protein n=1 Tax=Aspergillus taichungensis TaxID=482145 RepID=A0A2J5HDQ9_9EURO|nr:hypothetical protein BDW42DRAFT_181518 [Aspergillus taichungensis]